MPSVPGQVEDHASTRLRRAAASFNKPEAAKRKRILLVDDHPLMRRGQADLLNREPDLEVCGEAGSAREAMEVTAKLKPDLVLVDMGLPDKDGLELIKDILLPQNF